MKKTGIIGTGLIGGSFALAIKKKYRSKVYGQDKYHLQDSIRLKLIDEVLTNENIAQMDVIIIATPVQTIPEIAKNTLSRINDSCLIFDTGSTKNKIAQSLKNHPKRSNFLLAHPIAGTEYSGPQAAFETLFKGKMNIVCNAEKTDKKLLEKAFILFEDLEMKTISMNSAEHDKHIAYVSHLSHISSFMLGKTVMDLEKDEKNIFRMAGSGFASTVRLAKSSPETWHPIFIENKKHILQSLDEYIDNLNEFKAMLYRENSQKIKETLKRINRIGNIIDHIKTEKEIQ